MKLIKNLFLTMRPKQWFKSLYIIFGAAPAILLMPADLKLIAWLLFLGVANLVMMQGAVYAINDIADAEKDRMHPRKRFRPIASGAVSKNAASAFAALLLAGALSLAYFLDFRILLIDLLLLANGFFYNAKPLKLRSRKWADVLSTAFNFPLRVMAGWYLFDPFNQARFAMTFNLTSSSVLSDGIQSVLFNSSPRIIEFSMRFSTVTLSALSMVVFTYFLACFLLFLKRFAEKNAEGGKFRSSLSNYSLQNLIVSAKLSAAFALVSLVLLAWSLKPLLLLLTPLFAYALLWYYRLAQEKNSPVAYPEDVFTKSKRFFLFGAVLLALALIILFA